MLNYDKYTVVYDVSDEYADFATNKIWKKRMINYENVILKKAKHVFVTTKTLMKKRQDTYLIENGVDLESAKNATSKIVDEKIKIGYVGALNDWIDFELLEKIAKQNEDKSIYLIGPTNMESSLKHLDESYENIHCLGLVDKDEVNNYIKSFDIGLLPFLTEDKYPRLKTVNSNKVFLYSYFGFPIISTEYTQVKELKDIVYTSKTHNEFLENINVGLNESKEVKQKRKSFAKENSWTIKIGEMINIIEKGEKDEIN